MIFPGLHVGEAQAATIRNCLLAFVSEKPRRCKSFFKAMEKYGRDCIPGAEGDRPQTPDQVFDEGSSRLSSLRMPYGYGSELGR